MSRSLSASWLISGTSLIFSNNILSGLCLGPSPSRRTFSVWLEDTFSELSSGSPCMTLKHVLALVGELDFEVFQVLLVS